VRNRAPIIGPVGVNRWPTQDMYFKGALFLHTLRNVVADDDKWWDLVRNYYQTFKYKNIYTTDVLNFFNEFLDMDLKPVFDQYLYFPAIPVLELKYENQKVKYRWKADVKDFNMPLKIRLKDKSYFIYPVLEWKTESMQDYEREDLKVETDLFYVNVEILPDSSS